MHDAGGRLEKGSDATLTRETVLFHIKKCHFYKTHPALVHIDLIRIPKLRWGKHKHTALICSFAVKKEKESMCVINGTKREREIQTDLPVKHVRHNMPQVPQFGFASDLIL